MKKVMLAVILLTLIGISTLCLAFEVSVKIGGNGASDKVETATYRKVNMVTETAAKDKGTQVAVTQAQPSRSPGASGAK